MSRNVLPATQTLAMLDPHNLVLELPRHSQADLASARNGSGGSEAALLAAHELTHWYDIIGTAWGQGYLDTLFAAFDRDQTYPVPAIDAYPAALALFDADRSILFPSYYKFVKPNMRPRDGPGEWQMQLTVGARIAFDGQPDETDPLLFVRFHEADAELARQPVSVGSLLELRALEAEVAAFVELSPLRPADERKIEEIIFQREFIKLFYHPELTTYSAAAHLLSQALGRTADTALVLNVGASLAHLALNVNLTHFGRLTPPAALQFAGARLRGFKTRSDRGFLFACFGHLWLEAMTEGRDSVMSTVLRTAGLPPAPVIYDAAQRFIERRRTDGLQNSDLRRIRAKLQEAGLQILRHRRESDGRVRLSEWANLPAPPMMDFDAESFTIGSEVLTIDEAEFLHSCWTSTERVQRQALRAGRGLDFQFTDFTY